MGAEAFASTKFEDITWASKMLAAFRDKFSDDAPQDQEPAAGGAVEEQEMERSVEPFRHPLDGWKASADSEDLKKEQEVAEVELDVLQPEADAAVDGRPVDEDTVLPNGAHKDLEFVTPAPTDQTRSSVAEQLQNAPEASPAAVETIRCPTCKGTGKVDKTSFLSLGQKMCKTCMGK